MKFGASLLLLSSLIFPAVLAFPQYAGGDMSRFMDWKPRGPDDVRSPCPGLNTLANHNILPHSGKGITHEALRDALLTVNVAPDVTDLIFGMLIRSGKVKEGESFNLDRLMGPGSGEHDGSLSRPDDGDRFKLDPNIFREYMRNFKDAKSVTLAMAADARVNRIRTQRARNPNFSLSPTLELISKAETILMTAVLSGADVLEPPIHFVRTFFEQEKFPVEEGWKPSTTTLTLAQIQELAPKMESAVTPEA